MVKLYFDPKSSFEALIGNWGICVLHASARSLKGEGMDVRPDFNLAFWDWIRFRLNVKILKQCEKLDL